jgi:hypothetical protein
MLLQLILLLLLEVRGIKSFKVWDPKIAGTHGLGSYQTFSEINGFDPVPGGGSYGSVANTRIESGQAFIVNSALGGTIQFTEAAKTVGSKNIVFRTTKQVKQLKTNLYATDALGNNLADGTAVIFDKVFSNETDADDVLKAVNIGENISIFSNGNAMAINAHKEILSTDTVQYHITNTKQQGYLLQFIPVYLKDENVTAYLEDRYLKTKEIVSLSDTTYVKFKITADPLSSVIDRFRVVLNRSKTPALVSSAGEEKIKKFINVYPNPVTNKTMQIVQNAGERGVYNGRIINDIGEVIYNFNYNYNQGKIVEKVRLPVSITAGMYRMKIHFGGKDIFVQNVLVVIKIT